MQNKERKPFSKYLYEIKIFNTLPKKRKIEKENLNKKEANLHDYICKIFKKAKGAKKKEVKG